MAALGELLTRLNPDRHKRGEQFERICQWFLTHDPVYGHELRRVWLWDEWLPRWGADAGIDLVAEDRQGRLWAIQAKAYAAVRLFGVCALALACAACGQSPGPTATSSSTETVWTQINPARIDWARGQLPQGYEVAEYAGPAAPLRLWSFGGVTVSQPPQCRALAEPAVDAATTRGWSASGPGGIIYALAAASGSPEQPESALLAECARWTLTSGHTSGTVTAEPAPDIEAAQTVAMSTAVTTVVEGGTETRSRADTFIAYLGGYVCFVLLVTDPGSPAPLQPGFAAELLIEVVSTLRG